MSVSWIQQCIKKWTTEKVSGQPLFIHIYHDNPYGSLRIIWVIVGKKSVEKKNEETFIEWSLAKYH